MKKIFYFASLCFCLFFMTSCNEGMSPSRISGWYSSDPITWNGKQSMANVYNFINSNTVISYGSVTNYKGTYSGGVTGEPLPNHSGWYFGPMNKKQYTYSISRNKLIITNGTILTINNDGSLTPDGSGSSLKKW